MAQNYTLGGDQIAATRLNFQHHLVKELFDGKLVDPDIPLGPPDWVIGDVCTGTGIWLAQLSEALPSTCKFEGLDINLTQQPPSSWLQSNVSFRYLDIQAELPDDLVERYDLINVQFTQAFTSDESFPPMLQSIVKMLKPGGYVQWTETLHPRPHALLTDSTLRLEDTAFTEIIPYGWAIMLGREFPKWTSTMREAFISVGLQDVKYYRPPLKGSVVQCMTQCYLSAVVESCDTVAPRKPEMKTSIDKLRGLADRAWKEYHESGVGVDYRMVRCIGRKGGFSEVI